MAKYRDESGKVRYKTLYTDKEASQQEEAKIRRRVARRESGLFDQYEEARKAAIGDLVDEFLEAVETGTAKRGSRRRKGRPSANYLVKLRSRLTLAFECMDVELLADCDSKTASRFLMDLVDGRLKVDGKKIPARSTRTRDHYRDALVQFGDYMVSAEKARTNPFADTVKEFTEADVTKERPPLTLEQVDKLALAARQRTLQAYVTANPSCTEKTREKLNRKGERRGVLYWTAVLTAIRADEARRLVWGDLKLSAEVPHLHLPAARGLKSKRSRLVPLVPQLVEMLTEERKRQGKFAGSPIKDSERVFEVPTHIAVRVRKDAKWAEIEYDVYDDDGVRWLLDFHALRTSAATILATMGVPPQITQKICDHKDVRTTMQIYTKLGLGVDGLRPMADILARHLGRFDCSLFVATDRRTEADSGGATQIEAEA